jgi:AraC-like DNA-binding protein
MHLSLLEALILFAGIFGVGLASILYFAERYRSLANNLLSLFLVSFSLLIIRNIVEAQGLLVNLASIGMLSNALIPLIGPAIFLYVSTLSHNREQFSCPLYIHFLPALAYLIMLCLALAYNIKSDEDIAQYQWLLILASFIQLAVAVQLISYIVAAIMTINHYHKWLLEQCSAVEALKLNWLSYLLTSILLLFIVWTSLLGADIKVFGIEPSRLVLETFWLAMSILVYWIGIYSLLHPEILTFSMVEDKKTKQTLPKAELSIHCRKLEDYMKSNKPYIDPTLSLTALAAQLNLNAKLLSQVINTGTGHSFYEYINRYRIESIKNILRQPDNKALKLEGVAYDSGIKSSSTFNRLFKKYVNMTPREYRAQYI